ncbi:MAG TPA: alpha/beta hydrolase [Thermoleophilaceae bacterium]|jgi:pimeloyl-ACP methyl ester carboxylesterase|nr:alpha/beta hydrolase [Thermoleophilaceae bacterium]
MAARVERQEVQLRQGRIAYFEAGDGPPLLFVHGVFANSALWSKLVPLLSDRYRCIAPDWPLGSHSLPLGIELSPPLVADMIGDFIDALDLEDVTLVGNDTGGALCQMFVVRHPGRVKRLVLTNCDAYDKFPPQPFTYLVWVARIPGSISLLALSMRPRFVRRLPIAYGWLAKRMPPEVEDAFVDPVMHDKGVRKDIASFLKNANKKQLMAAAERFGSIQIPVVLAWGEDDKAFKIGFAERMARDIPNARLVRIPDSYTFVPLDQPELLAETLADERA